MGVSVVGHYASLSEARVACCALQSAGFMAWTFDDGFGTMQWNCQVFLRGFRVAVPSVEGREAWEFLREIQPPQPPLKAKGWTFAAMLLAIVCMMFGTIAWAWVAARNGPARWRKGAAVIVTATYVISLALYVWWRMSRHY
jgi:hypothetical protein